MPEIKIKPNVCGTCKHWSFKVSSEEGRCFGSCLNNKLQRSCYLSIRFPDHLQSTDEYHRFKEDVDENVEVRFEEHSFGCMYHEDNE